MVRFSRDHHWRRRASARGFLLLTAALAMVVGPVMLSGCQVLGYLAQPLTPKAKPVYELEKRRTLVLVDDPMNVLGSPRLSGVIASHVGFNLQREKALREVVPPRDLADLAARHGKDFAKVPLDQVGRELGAAQVIAVYVEAVGMEYEPGMIRPTMLARVKVIDVASGRRMFPSPDDLVIEDPARATRGFPVTSTLFYRLSGEGDRGTFEEAIARLAERSGRDIARLFHKFDPERPGSRFRE